jgi:serine/threonine protein kinase
MLAPDTVLQNRYRIVRLLGQGGMGAVYEAIDERLDTTVALKETLFADERLRKQFEREARLLARMHHPALPRVSDHFAEGEGQFLVMQFIPGDDLSQMRF